MKLFAYHLLMRYLNQVFRKLSQVFPISHKSNSVSPVEEHVSVRAAMIYYCLQFAIL